MGPGRDQIIDRREYTKNIRINKELNDVIENEIQPRIEAAIKNELMVRGSGVRTIILNKRI